MTDASLRTAAETAGAHESWSGYARYAELRNLGLRRPALRQLDGFIEATAQWSVAQMREFASFICRLRAASERADAGLVPQPLAERVLCPTLRVWMAEELQEPNPPYWLALLNQGVWCEGIEEPERLLRESIRRDPEHRAARLRLADLLLAGVDFSQHHLPDEYVGEPAADVFALEEADRLLTGLGGKDVDYRREELAGLSERLREWTGRTE